MWCRYVDVNNSGWSKSSSERDWYFLCVVFHLRQKDGTSVRRMNESRCRGGGRNACSRYVRWKERGGRKKGGSKENQVKQEGREDQKHGKEDREWLTTGCVESSGTTPERRRSGEKMEGRRDDANGFWTWCIQLLRRAWIKHCPGQSGRTGYGASHLTILAETLIPT